MRAAAAQATVHRTPMQLLVEELRVVLGKGLVDHIRLALSAVHNLSVPIQNAPLGHPQRPMAAPRQRHQAPRDRLEGESRLAALPSELACLQADLILSKNE